MRVSTVPTTVPTKERYSAILGMLLMGLLHATVCCIHVCMGLDILINFGHGGKLIE